MKIVKPLFVLFITGITISCEKDKQEINSESKLLEAFCEFGDGIIDTVSNKVTFKVSEDVDITKIIPTFNISKNATIYPPSNVATDYSNPVTYTITSEDKSSQYVFTVIAYKPLVEFSVYDCTNWTPAIARVPVLDAIINVYSETEDVGTTNLFDKLISDEDGKATLHGSKGINYFITVKKNNKSNIINGYVLAGTYNNQYEVDNALCNANAGVGEYKFKDINGDGCIFPDDRYNYDNVWISSNFNGIRQIELYIASTN